MKEDMAKKGRGTDTKLAHLSLGEVVIPRRFLDDEEFRGELAERFAEEGASLEEFTVGEDANKINPETGYPEFFFGGLGKLFKKIAPIAAIAAPILAPGIGTAIGGSLLGAGAAGSATLGNALLGGGLGLASGGGLKGALLGAGGGALGANIGTAAGTPLGGGLQGATQGSGILGAATRAVPSLGSLVSGGLGGSPVSKGLALSNVFSGLGQDRAIKSALAQQKNALAQAQQNIEFNPEDYINSPDYQFQLEQGQQAMDRANAARGGFFSGNALREAQQFGQGLASGFYNDAFSRRQQETDRLNNLILQRGSLGAQSTIGRANNLSSTLADIFNPVQRYY